MYSKSKGKIGPIAAAIGASIVICFSGLSMAAADQNSVNSQVQSGMNSATDSSKTVTDMANDAKAKLNGDSTQNTNNQSADCDKNTQNNNNQSANCDKNMQNNNGQGANCDKNTQNNNNQSTTSDKNMQNNDQNTGDQSTQKTDDNTKNSKDDNSVVW